MTPYATRFRAFAIAAGLGLAGSLNAGDAIPAALIRLPESTSTVFVAETASNRFYRFDRQGDRLVANGSYYMSIGQNGPGKQRDGDRRTPLGVYFVTEQLDTSRLHEKYGITAFVLDYPNAWDRLAGRDGDGIWIHGVLPTGGRRPERDTDGCIALPNEDLGQLEAVFRDNLTPVVVTEKLEWADRAERDALSKELAGRVRAWADSQQQGDLLTWLSLYSDEFQHWGMSKPEWLALQVQGDRLRSIEEIAVSDLLLLAYPEEKGLYLSRFLVETSDGDRAVSGRKRLYWRRHADGELRIVAADNG